jgi:hypothetical protein
MTSSKRLRNKAQLAIFMVLAVVVLLIFAFIFLLYQSNKIPLEFTAESIQGYLDGCLRQTAEDALELLGRQGGSIQLEGYVAAPSYGISYWLKDTILKIPTEEHMEEQLAFYIHNNLEKCINLEDFEGRGWRVEAGRLFTRASLNKEDVSFTATYPLTVRQQERSLAISRLTTSVPVRLQHIHSTASHAAEFMQQHGKIDLTALDASGLNVTIFPYNNALMYQFSDEHSLINNKNFVFNIALS